MKNTSGSPLIYARVLRIEAQKGQVHKCDPECARAGHNYYHDFKTPPVMRGLPAGTLITLPSGETMRIPERALLIAKGTK